MAANLLERDSSISMKRLVPRQNTFPAALLVVLILGAFLAVLGHIFLAGPDHDREHCPICTWFHVEGWIVFGPFLLVYFAAQYVSFLLQTRLPFLLLIAPLGRSPPIR